MQPTELRAAGSIPAERVIIMQIMLSNQSVRSFSRVTKNVPAIPELNITPQKSYFPIFPEKQFLFSDMINHIGAEVMLIDHNARIVYVNEATAKGLGFSKKFLLNRHVTDFLKDKMSIKKWRRTYFQKLMHMKNPLTFTLERIIKGGKKQTIEVTAVHMRYGSRGYILSTARDITQRKQLDELLRQSEKMKATQFLVFGIAQEIKHPLQVILGRIHGLINNYKNCDYEYIGYKEFKNIMQALENIYEQLNYCFTTTSRLVSLNKKKVGLKRSFCEVNLVIREYIQRIKKQSDFLHIRFQLRLSQVLPKIAIENSELNQVLHTIVTNSIQAMPGGGKIVLTTFFNKPKHQITIEIKDEGVGISKEDLSHIFEPFVTTKDQGMKKNAGLGLAIVYSIIKSYGGEIRIKSSLRKGTLVKIDLPILNNHRKY